MEKNISKKILIVNKFHYLKGGSERYCFNLAEAFQALGNQVIFFAMKDDKNVPCPEEKYFVDKVGRDAGLIGKLKMILHIAYSKEAYQKMTELLNAEHPDLVILNLVHKQLTCSVIDAIRHYSSTLPIFWTMHDLICACPAYTMIDGKGNICEKCLDGNFNHCKENNCCHGSKLMSILSTYEAKQIRKKGWYDMVNLYICPSEFYQKKLTEAHFTKSPIITMRNPLPINQKYEVNDHHKDYFLYFGRLSKEKGVDVLINAMKNVSKGKLFVVGTGPEEENLKKLTESLNLQDRVEFKGYKQGEELWNYVRDAIAVILPSQWYENGPYSAMEAMALGKPLIVSSYGGLPELVEDGKTGFIFHKLEELPQLLEKVEELPEEEYNLLCKGSKERAEEIFSTKKYCLNLLKKVF